MTASPLVQSPGGALDVPAWGRFAAAAVGIVASGTLCLWVAATATPSPLTHAVALFFHVAALVVGFGSVLAVDWMAFLWLVGRRELSALLGSATNLAVPIWVGYAGLAFTGVLLEPDLASPWTRVKLALVLVMGVNGVLVAWLHGALQRTESPRLFVASAISAMVSQGCWWGATVVGFVNAH